MTTQAVDQLLYLLGAAFESQDDWHSLLGNLHDVTPEEWSWAPPGGRRSIREIVRHVGGCKLMHENHAFGDASLGWEDDIVAGGEALAEFASAVAWLRV